MTAFLITNYESGNYEPIKAELWNWGRPEKTASRRRAEARKLCFFLTFSFFWVKPKEKGKMQSSVYFVRLKEIGKIIQTEKVVIQW